MRIWLLFSLLLLGITIPGEAIATDAQDSLLLVNQVNELISEAQELKNHDVLSAIKTIKEAEEIALLESNERLYVKTQYYYSLYLFMLGSNQEAAEIIEDILPFYRELSGTGKSVGILLNRLGKIYSRSGQYDKSLQSLEEAVKILEELEVTGALGTSYIYLVDLYIETGDFAIAIDYCQRALDLFLSQEDPDKICMVYSTMGDIYRRLKDYDKAQAYYHLSLENRHEVRNQQFLVLPLKNLGLMAMTQQNYADAEDHLLESLSIVEKLGNAPSRPEIYYNLAQISDHSQDMQAARTYLEKAHSSARAGKFSRFENLSNLLAAEFAKRDQNGEKAVALARSAYDWAASVDDFELAADAAHMLASCYAKEEKFQEAYKFRTVEEKTRAKFINEQKVRDITAAELKYQFEQQQKQERILADATLARQKQLRNLLVFGLAIVLAGIVFLMRINLDKQKANKTLSQKNEELIKAEAKLEDKNNELRKYIESNIKLEQFAHIASHDLRSPLRTVSSFLGLLKRELGANPPAKQKEYIDYIDRSAARMSELVEDLLQFSKINAQELEMQNFSSHQLVEEVIDNLNFSIRSKNAMMVIKELPENEIWADRIKLRQVFQNLIGNALKFVPESRHPKIEISCDNSDERCWLFSVRDNGIGIEKSYQNSVFETFNQLETKDKSEGTGMGLAICKKIIQNHGGRIWLESEPGIGTTFYFTLPKAARHRLSA